MTQKPPILKTYQVSISALSVVTYLRTKITVGNFLRVPSIALPDFSFVLGAGRHAEEPTLKNLYILKKNSLSEYSCCMYYFTHVQLMLSIYPLGSIRFHLSLGIQESYTFPIELAC